MYFYKENGKQHLDLKGDLIISHNDKLVKTRVPSAAPTSVKSPDGFILNLGKLGFFNKIRATWNIIKFVWTAKPLAQGDTNYRESYRAEVKNSEKLKTVKPSDKLAHLDEDDNMIQPSKPWPRK